MAGVAFAVEGDGVGFATESYAASAFYTTLASLSGVLWRIRWVSWTGNESISRNPSGVPILDGFTAYGAFKAADLAIL